MDGVHGRVHGARRRHVFDSAAEVQGYVDARRLSGSGHVLEGVARAVRVEEQRAGPIWPVAVRSTTAEIQGTGGGIGSREVLERLRRLQRHGAWTAASKGGPGGPGNGVERAAATATTRYSELGEVDDDTFAKTPWLLFAASFPSSFFYLLFSSSFICSSTS